MRVATVRVRDDYSPQGFKIINETDLNEFHLLWPDEEIEGPAPKHLLPGEVVSVEGVMERGVVTIGESGAVLIEPLPTEAPTYVDVDDLRDDLSAQQEAIPADWLSLHWKKQVKLAKDLGFEGDATPDAAKEFIAMTVESRAGQ